MERQESPLSGLDLVMEAIVEYLQNNKEKHLDNLLMHGFTAVDLQGINTENVDLIIDKLYPQLGTLISGGKWEIEKVLNPSQKGEYGLRIRRIIDTKA